MGPWPVRRGERGGGRGAREEPKRRRRKEGKKVSLRRAAEEGAHDTIAHTPVESLCEPTLAKQ